MAFPLFLAISGSRGLGSLVQSKSRLVFLHLVMEPLTHGRYQFRLLLVLQLREREVGRSRLEVRYLAVEIGRQERLLSRPEAEGQRPQPWIYP